MTALSGSEEREQESWAVPGGTLCALVGTYALSTLGTDDIEMSQLLVLLKWMESVKENEKSKKREGSSVKQIAA